MVGLTPNIPSENTKQVIITTDQTAKGNANTNVIIGITGKIQKNFWNEFKDLFTPLYYKKIEVHPQQGQSILVRVGDLSKAFNISKSTIYNLSQNNKLDKFIKENNVFKIVDKIEYFKIANPQLIKAFDLLAHSPTFKAEDIKDLINDERMMDPKMQGAVIKAAELIRKKELSPSSNPPEIYARKTKSSYGFIIDRENKIYIRSEFIGKGSFKKVKGALQLQKLKKWANVSLKGAGAEAEVKAEQEALALLQGCRHIVKPSKFQLVTKTKNSKPKYVLMQKRLAGDGFKLLNANPRQKLQAFRDFAEGLGDIHDRGLIHSDVKLANFLIGSKGEGYVHDFGFLTTSKKIKGYTKPYVPPEKFNNFGPKFDSYGLGVSMLQAFAVDRKEARRMLNEVQSFKDKPEKMEKFFNQVRNNVQKSPMSEGDREILLKMLLVAKQLLDPNPDTRLSCKEAATSLAAIL